MTLEQRVERIETLLGLGEDIDSAAFALSMQRTQMLRSDLHTSGAAKAARDALQVSFGARRNGGDGEKAQD